jgi:ABC-type phosphate/phosphonate transport system permease subunit
VSKPALEAQPEDGLARRGGQRGWRQHSLFWPCAIGLVYLLVTLAVMAVEYISEMSKLSRGFYTDTFSPFFYTHILTFPASAVHSDWPGYPGEFNETQWKSIVQHALGPVALTALIQTTLLTTLLWLVVSLNRHRHGR